KARRPTATGRPGARRTGRPEQVFSLHQRPPRSHNRVLRGPPPRGRGLQVMTSSTNSRPARSSTPLVVRQSHARHAEDFIHLLTAGVISALVNGGLVFLMFLLSSPIEANTQAAKARDEKGPRPKKPELLAKKDDKKDDKPPPLSIDDVDPDVKVEPDRPSERKLVSDRKSEDFNIDEMVRPDQ